MLFRSLEGGAFAVRGIFQQIRSWCGPPAVVRLTGSGANSSLWANILANVVNRDLEASDSAVEGRGAAIFAAVALGLYADYDSAATGMVPIKRRFAPTPELAQRYDELFGEWQRVADATRPLDSK